jgi:hypothetical protein
MHPIISLFERFLIRGFNHLVKFPFLYVFLLSILLIFPFILVLFFVHPFADDLAFASMIKEQGSFGFIVDFFQKWSGRYTSLSFLSICGANPEERLFLYGLLPFLFLIFLTYSLKVFLEGVLLLNLKKTQVWIISGFVIALHIVFMPELFSAIYWHCSSFYLLVLAFYLIFLQRLVKYYHKGGTKQLVLLVFMIVFISGLHELLIIYNIIIFTLILILNYWRPFQERKIDKSSLLLLSVSVLIFLLIMIFSGNDTRMDTNDSTRNLFALLIRSFYEIMLLDFMKILFSPLFLLLILGSLLLVIQKKYVSPVFDVIRSINPLVFFLIGIGLLFVSHSLTLIAAGYTLPGRVLNINIFLTYIWMFFQFVILFERVNFSTITEFKIGKFIIFSILIVSSFSMFSKNYITVASEIRGVLPAFNMEMNARYQKIIKAVEKGDSMVIVEPINANPKTFTLGEYRKNINFYNSNKWLFQASMYFGIKIKLSRKPDRFEFD